MLILSLWNIRDTDVYTVIIIISIILLVGNQDYNNYNWNVTVLGIWGVPQKLQY